MIIAIDGPSGAGKGALAQCLARYYDLAHLETGLLYRAVAWKALEAKIDLCDIEKLEALARSLQPQDLEPMVLRSETTAAVASQISVFSQVRQALYAWQREFALHPPEGKAGAILDGRDIGTKICPDADFKFFLTASLEERAKRRHKELQSYGIRSIYTTVLQELQERDKRDQERPENPLKPAEKAYVIDTSGKTIDEIVTLVVDYISNHKGSAALLKR